MGLSSLLFGKGAEGAGKAMEGAGKLARDLRMAFTGEIDPEKKADIELKLTELEASLSQGQLDINKTEASNTNIFVSGWRPALGWICAFGIGYNFILYPLLSWVSAWYNISPPNIDVSALMQLVLAMLGLGGMRSWEKVKGVHRN